MTTSSSPSLIPPVERETYDPTQGAQHVAYREINGTLSRAGFEITLTAWVIAFQQHPQSRARYRRIEHLLGDVDANGYLPVMLNDVPGAHFASMSERTDVIGEFTTIWITSVDRGSSKRGAVLASLNGAIVHLLSVAPFEADGKERGIYLLESIARRISEREPEMLMANEVDEAGAVSRLPALIDVEGLLENPSIVRDHYSAS